MMKVVLVLIIFVISTPIVFAIPVVQDPALVIEEVTTELSSPTSISFVGSDILVLQKNDGKVRLIRDGTLQINPVLDVPVSKNSERGLLGIESVGNDVYLFFTESLMDGGSPLGNRIYKYSWDGTNLINPVLIKDLPDTPGPNHNGGVLTKDLDNNIFAIIGDLNRNGVLQNFVSVDPPDNTSVILPIDPSGPILAMGIRNSFGLTIDPITGNMWDTENGPSTFDEINLISTNFNSGWESIMGPATQEEIDSLPGFENFVYSDPEFSWEDTVAPTSILFIDAISFANYSDSVFVGDCKNTLYKFILSESRDSFVFSDPDLSDLVLNIGDDSEEIVFGNGFGCITDLEMGPDGFLYVSSVTNDAIYRIMPADSCIVPTSGDMTITVSCTLYSSIIVPGSVLVQNNSVFTVPSGVTLDIDFSQNNLSVESGSGTLIKIGGKVS